MNPRRPSRVQLEPISGLWAERWTFHGARWGLLAALALITYALFPVARSVDTPVLDVGEVSPVEVLAPYTFPVPRSPGEVAQEAGALAAQVRPIYTYQRSVVDSVVAQVEALFTALDAASSDSARVEDARRFSIQLVPDEAHLLAQADRRAAFRRALVRLAQEELVRGVPASGTVERELSRELVVRRDGQERVVPRDSILSFSRYLARRVARHPAPNSSLGDQLYIKLIHGVFRPTLVPEVAETERLRAAMRASVDTIKGVVRANERIVAAHEVVTPEARDRLLALRAELLRRGERRLGDWRGMTGQIITNAAILAVLWLMLMLYRRQTYDDLRQLTALTGVFAITAVGAWLILRFVSPAPELIPIPFAAMLVTILMDGRVAMVVALVLAFLLGTQAAYGGENALYIAALGGVAGTLGLRVIRRRSQLLAAAGLVAVGFVLAAMTLGLRYGWLLSSIGASALRGVVNGLVS
ncbi:MAG TPA: hypothetical protein VEG33_14995, partial [Streptosporangiaceae bacterium]|nr:hypothetical protein [Streptosporangiaceae bacterium]